MKRVAPPAAVVFLSILFSVATAAGCAGGDPGVTEGTGGGGGSSPAGNGGSNGGGGASPAGNGGSGGGGATDGGSGGSGAGGSVGAGADAGPPTCASLPFCDDFESGTAGQAPDASKWVVDLLNGQGTVRVDGAMGHSSTKSLHVNANNAFHTMAMIRNAPLFPLPAGVLFGRVYVRIPVAHPQGHVTWIEAGTVANDNQETRIGSNIGAMDINRWPGDTEQRAPSAKLMAGMWHCLEFQLDSQADEARVWLDSTELTDLHVTNWVAPMQQNGNNSTPILNWAPDYQAIRFGWELGNGEIWFDDIALGYARIGCL